MPLSTIFQLSFIGGGNRSTRRKLVLSQVTDKPYHIMLYRVHLAWVGFKLTTLVVIGANCIGSLVGGRGRKFVINVNPTTIWSRPQWPRLLFVLSKKYSYTFIVQQIDCEKKPDITCIYFLYFQCEIGFWVFNITLKNISASVENQWKIYLKVVSSRTSTPEHQTCNYKRNVAGLTTHSKNRATWILSLLT
jgi:hypothetical protein